MPELPEVETVCKGLSAHLTGKRITQLELNRNDLRFPFPDDLKSVEGREVIAIHRRAKYILIRLEDDLTMLVHLGMSGRFRFHEQPVSHEKHDHVIIHLDDGSIAIYTDPRRFGVIDLIYEEDNHRLLNHLGPEPLSTLWNGDIFMKSLRERKVSIKSALMNQKIVVGVGNIYASEALFLAKVSPNRKACNISLPQANRIHHATVQILENAITAGGSTLRDGQFTDIEGELGYFPHQFAVYDREGLECVNPNCTKLVKKSVHQGRSTYHCTACQR